MIDSRIVALTAVVGLAPPSFIAPANAQTTLIVDQSGGGAFTEIQPAIDAAHPGDIVRVLPGARPYLGFRVTKRLSVLGSGSVQITGSAVPGALATFDVRNLAPGDTVVVRGFREAYSSPYIQGLLVQNCAGAVHLSDLQVRPFVTVRNCAQVSVDDCTLEAVQVTASDVLFAGTSSRGYADVMCGCTIHALILGRGVRATVAGGNWQGADGFYFAGAGPGIILQSDAQLTLTGDDRTVVQAGQGSAPAISVAPGATLVLDPDPLLVATGGSPSVLGTGRVLRERVPYLVADVEQGALLAGLFTALGAQSWLLVSPFAPPVSLGAPLAPWWTPQPAVLAVGIVQTKPHVERIPLPPLPAGTALPVQALVLDGTTVALSNAAVEILAH
ncbi:MAG: hypothetical protein AAF628_35960 [Planctomycetota bacterium]